MAIANDDVFNLDELSFETVIGSLNKYFANDKYNTSLIEIRKTGVVYLFSSDDLIAWLRIKHDIFYYPGMEAKYAKTEQISPFSERMMDKGALNSLKKLYKNVTGEEDETSSHTLIASTISCNFNNKDRMISLLKEQNELLKDEIRNCNAELATKWTKTSLINWLQQRARHKGVELDDTFLYSDDIQYDWTDIVDFLFDEIVKMRGEIENLTETNCKDFAKAVKARAEYAESVSRNTEKSDINKLISDYCNKFDIMAPSPDSSDRACVEYLFLVVDLERKHRAAVGKQMVDDYEKDIMDHIRQEASRNGYTLPEKVDGEPLTIERVFHELLELMRMRGEELRTLESKCRRLNKIVEELNTLNNEIKEEVP